MSNDVALEARPGTWEVVIGAAALICWILIVAIGAMLPSAPYRNAITASTIHGLSTERPADRAAREAEELRTTNTATGAGAALKPAGGTAPTTKSASTIPSARPAAPTTFDLSFRFSSYPAAAANSDGAPASAGAGADGASVEPNDVFAAALARRLPRTDVSGISLAGYVVVAAISFSATNLFFVSIFGAHLGAMAKRWNSAFITTDAPVGSLEVRRFYTTAALRGFLVYAVVLSGTLVFGTERTYNDVGQGQYLKMAGLLTALSFLSGYEPRVFGRVMKALEEMLEEKVPSRRDNQVAAPTKAPSPE